MTTIVLVRKNNEVVVAGDGQVSMGNTVVKSTASKVRKIDKRDVVEVTQGVVYWLLKNNFHCLIDIYLLIPLLNKNYSMLR